MKLSSIFKKEKVNAPKVEALNKKQLSKVIGGGDGTTLGETSATEGGPLKGIDVQRAVSTPGVK